MPSYPGGVGLMIGVPWDGKPVCLPWSFALMNLHPPMNYDVRWCLLRGMPVDEARNEILKQAINQKCKYLFFLGTDTSGPAHGLQQLIFHLENFREKKYAMVGGIYVRKSRPSMPMVFRGNGIGPYMDWKVGEVFEVSGIGMDWTLIDVEAVKDLPQPWFKTIQSVDDFKDNKNQATMWTEDLFFCKKVTDAGLKIMADGGLLCEHWDNQNAIPWKMDPNAKPMRPLLVQRGRKRIVDLGCGKIDDSYKTNEGQVVRVDIREDVEPDYRCDLRILPFQSGEFDVVYSSHTLEHFARTELDKVVDEWIRVMKPDGELRLVLPNLEWAARHILNGEIDADVMNVIYGAQTYHENFHKVGFTPKMLEELLSRKGFTYFARSESGYHMMTRAWKVTPPEEPQVLKSAITSEGPMDIIQLKPEDLEILDQESKENKTVQVKSSSTEVEILPWREELVKPSGVAVQESVVAQEAVADVAVEANK